MTPYYDHAGIQIFHGDCREILPELGPVDLVLTDPPYGIDWNTDYTRFTNSIANSPRKAHQKIVGDSGDFDIDIIFGDWELIWWGAHLAPWKIKAHGSWLVWDKRFDNGKSFLSDAELAWWSQGKGVYIFKHTWQGMIRNKTGEPRRRNHPNEKPLSLMKWCIEKAKSTGLICDPYMGSGTTLRAAKDLDRKAIGIEIEEKYCEIAAKRLSQEVLQL